MSHIAEATTILAPPSRADLLEYISRLPTSKDGRPLLRLKAGFTHSGLRLEHDVEVEFDAPRGEHGGEFQLALSWRPVGTELLPAFKGLLRFERDANYPCTWIMLQGDYDPPLGRAGKAFDAVAGERIARSTVRALLDDLRAALDGAMRSREM
jgi:hypothetical protein